MSPSQEEVAKIERATLEYMFLLKAESERNTKANNFELISRNRSLQSQLDAALSIVKEEEQRAIDHHLEKRWLERPSE